MPIRNGERVKKRVLIFPCGSEIGLEIHRSLRFSKAYEVYGASSTTDHGAYVYENYIDGVPFVDSIEFVEFINATILRHKIDFVFPAHDSVVLRLAQNRSSIDATLITSPVRTCEVARSKRLTYERLKGVVAVPEVYNIGDDLPYPVFLKPDVGQGSKGTLAAHSLEELQLALKRDSTLLILENLPGEEYTIDCFTDRHGELRFVQGRERVRIANGISVSSRIVSDAAFEEIASRINRSLTFRGVWFFQCKRNTKGGLVLMEVAPRVAGAMGLCRMQGVNLPLLSLYDAQDMDVAILKNDFDVEVDRALATRYRMDIAYDTVYVDLDDTLIVEGNPNYLLIGLLYKFLANNKRIVLVTKHAKEVSETLANHRISESIFDDVIKVGVDAAKSDYLIGNSIFIDDSFEERRAAYTKYRIPVFDVSEAVELL